MECVESVDRGTKRAYPTIQKSLQLNRRRTRPWQVDTRCGSPRHVGSLDRVIAVVSPLESPFAGLLTPWPLAPMGAAARPSFAVQDGHRARRQERAFLLLSASRFE